MAQDDTVTEEDFAVVMAGLGEAVAYVRGDANPADYRVHVPENVDVRAVRDGFGLTQAAFAAQFGFSKAAVTDWEQGRRRPEASARVLLTVIAREPDAVRRALEPVSVKVKGENHDLKKGCVVSFEDTAKPQVVKSRKVGGRVGPVAASQA